MKKRQVRNDEAKQNKKLNIDPNNKNRRINTKNLPTFILIGLIIMLIIIVIIYYVFLRYAPEMIITYSGYAVEGKTMVENLKNSDVSNVNPYLGLVEVHENDLLYKRLNTYYIGEDDKKEIDINYPIYINEGNALLNIGPTTRLITVNYEEVEGYPDFMMTDGVMYNGADITRADGNKYIFLKSEDEIYTNVGKINISTALNDYEIREFSNIYFTEDYIAYYEMQDGANASNGNDENSSNDSDNAQNEANNVQNLYMQYKRINDIDMDSKIKVNDETMTYKEFLERLGIIQAEENNNTEEIVNGTKEIEETAENIVNEPNEETEQEQNNESNTTTSGTELTEQEWQEGMWEKPTVSCTDFESGVYTISTNLSVTDRAGAISRGVIFEIYLDGRLNRRALATQTGNIEITNLQPDTEFEIRGIFYYYDENGVEQEEEFYTGTVKTKPISALGTIDFSFKNGEIYSNKIELIHLKLNNNLNEEVIRGISRIQVEIGDVAFRLTNDQIDQLKAGKEITYQTSESLASNSKIKYKITAFDRFGNELKAMNNEGETITSKQSPIVSITATKQDVTEVSLDVTLNNKDNVSLENYRYEIANQSGDIVKQGILGNNGIANDGSKETLTFNDLDPNGYYQIIIYGDYDLDNGEGMQQNAELGRTSFVTRPLASLGYMQVHIDDKEVTQNSMNLGISIDENQTDARLLAILDKVEVVIYDQGKNVESNGDNEEDESENDNQGGTSNNTQNKETEVQRITFTDEQVEQLKISEEVELNLEQLNSNIIYRIDVITSVKQGTVETVVEDKQNLEQVITLKMPAEVQVRNQFVIGAMIDLDIRIEDIDGAVLTNQVRIEVRDKDNKLIDLSEMATNAEYERKTYEDLTPNETYRIIVYAPQYNIGSTDATYEADYVLKEIEIVTETGISGNLDLIGLEKTPTGKNLIDVSSKVNWYEKCFNTSYTYGINYNEDTKILTLGGTRGNNQLNYYNLSNYLGEEITISFKARITNSTKMSIIEKSTNDFNNTSYSTYYTINDLTSDWQEYAYTITLNKTGYIGLGIANEYATVEIQDLQAELGNRKTDYETFQYDYNANVAITVIDARDEIETNDYFIRIYKNDEQIQELRYEELGENNKVENVQKTYNIEPDANYRIELLVKIADRYYELDSQEFSTENGRELKGIFDRNDFLKIQPYGEYIILNDINLSNYTENQLYYTFGSNNMYFEGKLDFNGNELKREVYSYGFIFYTLGRDAVVENLVFDVEMRNTSAVALEGVLARRNYGTIRNIQLNVSGSERLDNSEVYFVCWNNYGTIENFVINLKKTLYINQRCALIVGFNEGTVKNGYAYGEDIVMISPEFAQCANIVLANRENGVVENIFTLININKEYNSGSKEIGKLVLEMAGNSTLQNVYSVGIGENTDLSNGPNVYFKNSKKVYNNYYFADEISTGELETKGNMLSLWDAQFQNQLINTDGAFIVDELVNEGFYPWVDMPDVMPAQDYIELPEVEDADLPDILSTKVLEQGTDTVKVQFSVNNPNSEQISDIQIANLDVEILSQEYSNGKSVVIAELSNPVICVSNYDVLSISTKGAFNSTYTRPYNPGERVINVDLYKEIWSINDWKNINSSPTENYMLMTDLDFVNEGNTVELASVEGILNGNGYSIKNVMLNNDRPLIFSLYGTLENLFVNNFNQEATQTGGMIQNAQLGSSIDNVHMKNVNITKTESGYAGGIARYAISCSIKNSSVNNIQISTEGNQSSLYLGGLVGGISSVTVENCYVKGISINDEKAVSSGIGGMFGFGDDSNSIENCYAEGRINSDNIGVGGILGNGVSNIENCYSKVDISTTNSNVGGIIGTYSDSDTTNISNNISIGNIYTASGLDSLNRTVGNSSDTDDSNYAYENQLLNGYVREEIKGATLLSKEEILNLSLGDSYNYDGKPEEILPKLYNTEGTELLPNQEDILVDNNTEGNIDIEVESIEATKPNTTEAEITVRIINPEEIEITGIEIEDMQVASITRNVTQDGITSITVRATPNRYYDSYKLTGIRYKTDNSVEEQIKEVENEIEVQFYKEIYTYEDWQAIEEGTYQNYRLMADIDFSGKTNVKNNITVNRLEAENRIYTLKNIELEFYNENTGLINNIKTSMKNIGFENITLTNTGGSGNYLGVIASNNGNLENIQFKDISITASGMNNIGAIGGMTLGNINGIEAENVTINGRGYVGGIIGFVNINTEGEITNITGSDITVNATGSYAGGIAGYQYGEFIETNNLSVTYVDINGRDYTGGMYGYIYKGQLNYFRVLNSEISGNARVGGIFGDTTAATNFTSYIRYHMQVRNSDIIGNGNYIGGIAGYSNCGSNNNWLVSSCNIINTAVGAVGTGGLYGFGWWSYISNLGVSDCQIDSSGPNVGGIIGYSVYWNGSTNLYYGYVSNSVVHGSYNVGGAFGHLGYAEVWAIYVNANVKADAHSAGGICGYMHNSYMTSARYGITIKRSMVLNTSVKAPTKAGGLIGDIATKIYRDGTYYYNNYIDADVISENASTGSLIIGGRPDENLYIENTYVYKYSNLNGNYVYATNDNIEDEQYLVRSDLEQQSTYTGEIGIGTEYWNYSSLADGKYPKIADSYLYYPELQTGVDLPTDPEITELNSLGVRDENDKDNANEIGTNPNNISDENGISAQSVEVLPSYRVYPTSVDEVNIDFSSVPEKVGFTYYVNGEEKETVELTKKTYTFKYNYQDTLEIKLANGQEEESITINSDDVKSEASLVENNNVYLLGSNLYINGVLQTGEYLNVYEGYALNSSGQVVDIATKQMVINADSVASENTIADDNDEESNEEVTTSLKQTTTALHTYNYKRSNIEVYGTYSTVDGNIKSQIYNVRNGQLSAISNNIDMKVGNSIVDNYNDKEYQTVLTTLGELIDLKEQLQYPNNFLSSNIKQIVQNTDAEKPEMMVLYNTGKVIVFNYVTGQVTYENDEKADSGLVSYLTRSFANIWSDYEDKQAEYAKSKELEAKLAKLPIEEAMRENNKSETGTSSATNTIVNNNDNTLTSVNANTNLTVNNDVSNTTADNSYITVYNADTGKYEVYSEDEILNGENENPVSETEKIKENGLEGVYGYDTNEEVKPQANGAVIVISIIAVAVIALVILRKVIVKNSRKEKNK